MSGERYVITDLVKIARIPEEAFERFLKEFPMMVATTRGHIALVEGLYDLAGKDVPDDAAILATIEGATWIDDDKGNVDISVSIGDDNEQTELVSVRGNYKTGEFAVKMPPASCDRSGEAGETRSGSTEGESAVPAEERADAQTPPSESPL